MALATPVSEDNLRTAFCLAERRLRGDENRTIATRIAAEATKVSYEKSLDVVFESALAEIFPNCSVHRDRPAFNRIDICVVHNNSVVIAIESKGIVSNSHSGDGYRNSLDLRSIRTKLCPDARNLDKKTGKHNCLRTDIAEISGKIPAEMDGPRYEVFIPVVYELYRDGGWESDWLAEGKPWVTLPRFKELRENLKDDLSQWFHGEDPEISLMHAAQSIELRDANELWLQQSRHRFPQYTSLEAYVSFFAFSRFVG